MWPSGSADWHFASRGSALLLAAPPSLNSKRITFAGDLRVGWWRTAERGYRWQLDPGSCPLQPLLQAEALLTRRELVALWKSLRRYAWRPCAPKRMAGETERRSYARSSRQSSAIFGGSTSAWRSSLLRRRSSPARTTEGHSPVQVAVVTPRRGGSDVRVSWLRLGGSACPCFRPGHYGSPGRQRRRQANGPISVRCGAHGARHRHCSLPQDRRAQ